MVVLTLGLLMPLQARAALETISSGGKSFYVLRSEADWDSFCQKVADANQGYDVNAMMAADFTISNFCGDHVVYRGEFDGNGHTLTVALNKNVECLAPFSRVSSCTIRNLHVAGSVTGGIHSAGLIGIVKEGARYIVNIEHVWVSAAVTTTSDHAGGFVGHGNDGSLNISDCRFDGTVTANGSNAYVGAFVGWSHNGSWTMHRLYEDGTYNNARFVAFSYYFDNAGDKSTHAWGSNNRSTLCLSSHTWGEVVEANRKMTSQDMVALNLNNEKNNSWKVVGGKAVPVGSYLPDVHFDSYDIVPGTDKGEEGMLKIPFSCDQALEWIEGTYTGEDGTTRTLARKTFEKDGYAGFFLIPATEPHKDLKLTYKLKDGLVFFDHVVKSDVVMHNPRNLTAAMLHFSDKKVLTDAGAFLLQWEVSDAGYADVIEGDQFLVMRSLTGQDTDLQTIGSVLLESGQAAYTYKDSTLVAALTASQIGVGGSVKVKYVVMRASALQLWGVSNNVTSVAVTCRPGMLNLLRVKNYSAQWADSVARTVSVKWEYADEYGAVWDNRAQMKMLVTTTNRDGAPVDTTAYELTADEMTVCQKTIQLARSCVNYKIELSVDPQQSPLTIEHQDFMVIRSADDWAAFCDKVAAAKGAAVVNASLEADIAVTRTVASSSGQCYCGIFEGNGHTVTVSIDNGAQSTSLFGFINSATIRNLHVEGTIASDGKFAGGLVGSVYYDNNLTVENCRVSATVNSRVTGDATNGGFVGILRERASVVFRNCVFDGTFEGASCHSNGGFIGNINADGEATIQNSLFAPKDIKTLLTNCDTWARHGTGGKLTLTNSYCTREYKVGAKEGDIAIHNSADWDTFCDKVETAGGNSDVNAVLMADISVTRQVATADIPYRGTFDGNGYTLTVNIVNYDEGAVFRKAGNCTIKNLHVAGNIETTVWRSDAAGLIASTSDNVTVSNCRVSATMKAWRVDGFLGSVSNTQGHVLTNCLFDGKAIGDADDCYGLAFVGYSYPGSRNVTINNCLDKGTYVDVTDNRFSLEPLNGSNNWSYNALDGVNNVGAMTADELVEELGRENWHVANGEVLPNMSRQTPSGYIGGMTADGIVALMGSGWTKDANGNPVPLSSATVTPALPTFFYENLGHIDPKSLAVETLPTSALLTWANESDEPVDYYEVWRKDKQLGGDFEPIATQITQMQYEDKKTSPVHQYIYKVRGVTSCEGLSYDETKEVEGMCVQTATVEGHLSFLDGSGVPGKSIITTLANGKEVTVTTDESGFFRISDLPYVDGKETVYQITTSVGGLEPLNVTFGTAPGENVVTGQVIKVEQSVKLSGVVRYEGTSIPVQGASFLVDGYEVHTAAGKVESDYEGNFAFRILPGDHDSIQVVKDGHEFWRGGFYHRDDKDPDTKKAYNFTTDVANIKFYDQTRVKLTGRIVGGKTQGELPLGYALSHNNLGDDLQMVLCLEGDNASRLVFDSQDRSKTTRDEVFQHEAANANDKKHEYKTAVHTTINRMVVTPDVYTGEYEVLLPPVKWKIMQITAKGYPTLFQDGQVGDVIDLSDSITLHCDTIKGKWKTVGYGLELTEVVEKYHAKYSRIYHSPVVLDYKQQGFAPFDYMGDRYYAYKDVTGNNQKLAVAYGVRKQNWPDGKQDSLEVRYTFGHPVFSTDKSYPLWISATERYYYNNNAKSDTIDIVQLNGGVVTIHNSMVSATHRDTLQLDSLGQGNYVLRAAQTPLLLTGTDALYNVNMTLLMDGTYYEAEPLKAYVFKTQQATGANDIITCSAPMLIDILRDPPGGTSKATLSKGSTLKYAYTLDLKWSAGIAINMGTGSGVNSFTGVVVAPMGAGAVGGFQNGGQNYFGTSIDLTWSGSGQRAFNYTMTAKEDISTSTDKLLVGSDGDLYIGVEQNIVVKPAMAIRAIPDSVFRLMDGQLKAGRTIEIAQGRDDKDSLLHLVRDEVVTYGPQITSDFVHSQNYIVKQLIPELAEHIFSLMFTGTEAEAQAQANASKAPVYLSLVGREDPDFGSKYKMIAPDNAPANTVDEVAKYQEAMRKWSEMIAQNEKEKLEATELVKNFDVDGAGSVSYSETFTSDYTLMNSTVSPFTTGTAGYFEDAGDGAAGFAAIVGPMVAKLLANVLKGKGGKTTAEERLDGDESGLHVKVDAIGLTFKFNIVPAMILNVTPRHSETKSYTRTESFSIGMDKRSHLSFNVYRVKTNVDDVRSNDVHDVFYNNNFYDMVEYDVQRMKKEIDLKNFTYARSFVYRTVAGATCRPWEDKRTTLFHKPGSVLDERTKKIENPVIKMDKQSISGVPYGEPARFKIYLTNESEQPEGVYTFFDIFQVESKNPDGAKMFIDGMPLTGTMRAIEVRPGQVTEKTLEVFAGEKYDYKGLQIGIMSQGDVKAMQTVAFDVHYLQTAGSITISQPGDKWIMNCDAPQEAGRGWYLPVVISGFDKNQHNFDHIELQYKETTRGDDYWTNLCGYYTDSLLYRAASGTKEMIPENGNIIARFFGEGQVMEKAYDLRAVLFCRNGNAFLTSSSKVLSGVKDTRRPQLFGTPEPKKGVVGAGDNIIFSFSEDIEYNYLQSDVNFEVLGETNETNVQENPSLLFGGSGYALTQSQRNFTEKNVTLEVMVKPDEQDADMPIFSHGTEGKRLQLWLTKEKHLKAVVDERQLVSSAVLKGTGFQRVAMVLNYDEKQLQLLYNDTDMDVLDSVAYSGYGPLVFGKAEAMEGGNASYFKGRMLQGRLWYRVLDRATLNRYAGKLLTGYELGLTDYYPMNDGLGSYAADYAQGGAHLKLAGASWAQPEGMSLRLDKDEARAAGEMKGLQLRSQLFQRDDEQDYTLMFWFRTTDANGTLIANGSGEADDEGARNKFFIGFDEYSLVYRTNGREYALGDNYCDDAWHHFALTVSRMRNVASIYIDNQAKAQLTTDSLGGMLGTRFYLGNTVWQKEGDAELQQDKALTGYIDGLALFEQALPLTLINRYTTKALGGDERGLLVSIDFDHQEQQKGGELTLQPYAWSNVVKYDNDGKPTGERDSVFVKPVNDILSRIDKTIGAPVQAHEKLRYLNFSFAGRNNQLLVNVDEQDARINKRNIYVTLFDIPDKNGNYTKSPITEYFFVDRNPLRWEENSVMANAIVGSEFTLTFKIFNEGAKAHTYKFENLPRWMTVNQPTDIIGPQGERILEFTINKGLDVGTYDQLIYLTDENGMAEPLFLELVVHGMKPGWQVQPELKRYSMNIVAQVFVGNTLVTDDEDIVGVFDQEVGGRCMGLNNIKYDPTTGRSMLYLTVYDSTTVAQKLFFRLWHHATGKVMQLSSSEYVKFGDQSIVGTVDNPVILRASEKYMQMLRLHRGWNWVSFNVYNSAFESLPNILNRFEWQEGDMLTEEGQDLTLNFRNGQWMSNSATNIDTVRISQVYSYLVNVQQERDVEIWGTVFKNASDRTIKLKNGWNSIGYTPIVNLPVGTALSDYFDDAMPGDVVKSQHEFAMFVSDGKGSGEWLGTLEYMKPGDGYMLKRNGKTATSFVYPYYESGTQFIESMAMKNVPRASGTAATMTMVAQPVGIELQEGDRLVAYAAGEPVGEATALASLRENDSPLFFISIAGDQRLPLTFAIERDDELVATTDEVLVYEPHAISGSPSEPTQISFIKSELPELPKHGWYTLQGFKLLDAPTKSGVYIHNGKKIVIR